MSCRYYEIAFIYDERRSLALSYNLGGMDSPAQFIAQPIQPGKRKVLPLGMMLSTRLLSQSCL